MQTIIGRITADGKITTLKDGRKVVNFAIAKNDRFKPKNADEVKQVTTYVHCAYWMGTGITDILKKGTLIEVAGRIGLNVYNNLQGEAKGSLTLHVQAIKIHSKMKSTVDSENAPTETAKEDLPF